MGCGMRDQGKKIVLPVASFQIRSPSPEYAAFLTVEDRSLNVHWPRYAHTQHKSRIGCYFWPVKRMS